MKNNKGITIINLVITIIVIVLIASITIFSGLNTVESVRKKEANDVIKAVHLALIANENAIPSGKNDGKTLSNSDEVLNRQLTNEDFEIMGLDYTTDNCEVVLNKSLSGDNLFVYNYTYTNSAGKKFEDIIHKEYIENFKTNTLQAFDSSRGVNRPVLSESEMIPLSGDSDRVKNVFTDNWYNYEKNYSHYATMSYKNNLYVWIPRFAYKIQDFYVGQSYSNIPDTAIDIVFLREDSDYMPNNEVLPEGYEVHPAFENGVTGFWVSVNPIGNTSNMQGAIETAKIYGVENQIGHLLKNSEYAATALLAKFLNNNDIIYQGKEYVAGIYTDEEKTVEDFDVYLSDYQSADYIGNVRGHALTDTPWYLNKKKVTIPESASGTKYLIRDVDAGGMFYYEITSGRESANYRSVIDE